MAHPNFTGGPIRRSIPSETAPVITDGDLVLVESGAIIEYVIAKHGGGHLAVTADSPDYADYLYQFHFANASMMPSTIIDITIAMVGGAEENETVRALRVSCLQ